MEVAYVLIIMMKTPSHQYRMMEAEPNVGFRHCMVEAEKINAGNNEWSVAGRFAVCMPVLKDGDNDE